MTMETNPKTITIVLGMLSGALITAALAAFDFWIFAYTDQRSSFLGYYSTWAPFAALAGAVGGFVAGGLLGFFLSLKQRGSLFGAVAGAIEGLALILLLLLPEGMSSGDTRYNLTIAAFLPIGAISGFLTSLVVSATTSSAKPKERTHDGVLGLQKNKADESGRP